MSVVLWPAAAAASHADLGGKAYGLLRLTRSGHDVPRWFIVSTRAFDVVCRTPRVAAALRALAGTVDAAIALPIAAELRRLILEAKVGADMWHEIAVAHERLASRGQAVAVRSSASVEDAAARSFAGQFATVLDVRGRSALERAVRECWASAFSDRALAYARLHAVHDPVRMAVVVQQMVDAQTSGVLFTRDPAGGDHDAIVIAAIAGLGQSLVAGDVDGSTYRVSRRTGRALRAPARDGTLRPDEVDRLRRLAIRLERELGSPQDVEWAIADGRIALLQSRPITAPPDVPPTVWDNANIVESFPEVTLPLTYSIAREAYAAVYRQALELVGMPRATIDEHEADLQRMIGHIRGRVYYRLNSWYTLLSLLPGASRTTSYMEQMMGVRRSMPRARPRTGARALDTARLLVLALRMAALALTLRRRIRSFVAHVHAVCHKEESVDHDALSPQELLDRYDRLRVGLFRTWQAPILNDFMTMLACGVLRRLVGRRDPERAGAVVNGILRDDTATVSTGPTKALVELARIVAADSELARTFDDASAPASDIIASARRHPAFAEAFDRYLLRYGHRRAQELKLEVPAPREDPSPLVATIRAYRHRPDVGAPGHAPQAAQGERMLAEMFDPVSALLLRWAARRAREHIRAREEMRALRGRVFALARSIFVALGRRLHERGHLTAPEDVFHLTVDELRGVVSGARVELRTLVAERRREFDAYASEPPPPDRFATADADGAGERMAPRPDVPGEASLRGTPAQSGRARGPARVMRSPYEELRRGEILVAHATDPGWVAAFPLAAGILVERGSVLSHSAILARELGIPAIVGIAGLTARVRSGQQVEMDGTLGTVTLLEQA